MSTYIIVRNGDYSSLSHHGVKGMKWGVRKEQKYNKLATKYAKKAETARTGIGKRMAIQKKYEYKYRADTQRAVNKSTGLKQKMQNRGGAESNARNLELGAKKASEFRSTLKSNKAKERNARQEFNSKQLAKHYRDVAKHSPSTIKRATYSARKIMKVPVKNVRTGKTSTYGKEMAKAALLVAGLTAAQVAAQEYINYKMG